MILFLCFLAGNYAWCGMLRLEKNRARLFLRKSVERGLTLCGIVGAISRHNWPKRMFFVIISFSLKPAKD